MRSAFCSVLSTRFSKNASSPFVLVGGFFDPSATTAAVLSLAIRQLSLAAPPLARTSPVLFVLSSSAYLPPAALVRLPSAVLVAASFPQLLDLPIPTRAPGGEFRFSYLDKNVACFSSTNRAASSFAFLLSYFA